MGAIGSQGCKKLAPGKQNLFRLCHVNLLMNLAKKLKGWPLPPKKPFENEQTDFWILGKKFVQEINSPFTVEHGIFFLPFNLSQSRTPFNFGKEKPRIRF